MRFPTCASEKASEKFLKNRRKMVPGRCQGDVWDGSGASRGTFQAGFSTQAKIDGKIKLFWEAPRTPRGPRGTPNFDPKSSFLWKRALPTWIFTWFCSIELLSVDFHWFCMCFSRKIDGKTTKKINVNFHRSAVIFRHGDPHETLYFIIRKLLFHFSSFRDFYKNAWEKQWQNAGDRFRRKNHHRMVPG